MRKKILGRTILGLFLSALLCAGAATDAAESDMDIVGVPSKGFKVTGLEISGRAVAAVVSTDLTKASCYYKPGGFYLVETDPDKLAAIKSEIDLSNSPGFDPGTRRQNRYVPPNEVVSGGWSSDGTTLTVTLQLADARGRMLLSRSGSGPATDFSNINAKVTKDLTDAMCGRFSFRTIVDVEIHSTQMEHNETHHSEAVYTPYPGSGTYCRTAMMQPGERCRFAITTQHASATAKWSKGSHTASSNGTGNAVEAELTRGAKGATLRLAGPNFAGMSPDEDDEHYIGICSAQGWTPMQFDLSEEELLEQGITVHKAIELPRLTRTFLASDGEIDKLSRFRDVFEDDRIYNQVFSQSRLKADCREIVLCYKVQFRLGRLMSDIVDKGANKYAYVQRARNLLWALLCQAILNDPELEEKAENFGRGLSLEAPYMEWLSGLATARCRFILSDLVEDRAYAPKVTEGNFSFMRTNAAYKRSMEIAYKRWRWEEKRLNR